MTNYEKLVEKLKEVEEIKKDLEELKSKGNNTGDGNTGDGNTGDWNTGDWNTGDGNTGNLNTGDWNTGDWNTGDGNTGYLNTGNLNTGDWNTGDWNTGNLNTGYFNIDTPKTIRCFGVEVDRELWNNTYKPSWLYFELTKWINEVDMTEEEKENNPTYKTTGGYLKKYDYKEAFKMSYEKASEEDREAVKKLPGFNSDIFFEISGISL